MPLTKVGLNVSALQNITPINISIPNNTADFLNQIPQKANEITGGLWGFGSMIAGFFIVMQVLRNEEPGVGYSLLRSSAIAACCMTIIGLFMAAFGYFTRYEPVAMFFAISAILAALTWKAEY